MPIAVEPIEEQNVTDPPIVVEPFEAQNVIDPPIAVEPIKAQNIVDSTIKEKSKRTFSDTQLWFINFPPEAQAQKY